MLLPDDTRLVHIGPHKTGTTTLQGAFHLARREAAKQGVHYAGPNRQPTHAAQAIAAMREGAEPPGIRAWRHLVGEVMKAKEPRVVISSEWFADARREGIRRVAMDLDQARVHVAVTLRPLGRILSSQWQQLAQAGWSLPYDRWLEAIFHNPAGTDGARFWQRHAHDRLIERWAEVFGPDRLTVVVADDRDRGALLRAFERLTGLRHGTLVAPDDRQNRSMTAAEIDLVRALHMALRELGIDSPTRLNLVLFGVAGQLKLRWPDAAEARIETPRWALEESATVARAAVTAIRSSGVRAIGDLDSLSAIDGPPHRPAKPLDDGAWAQLTAQASMGILGASGLTRRSFGLPRDGTSMADGWPDFLVRGPDSPGGEWASPSSSGLSTERLLAVLASRVRGTLSARFGGRPVSRVRAPSIHSSEPEVEYRSRG